MSAHARDSGTEQAADQLHSAAIHLLRRVWSEDRKTGLTPARLSALSVLVFGGARSLGELADAEHVTAPTMSAIVKRLQEDGLVRRRPHPDDRRALTIEPTAKGTRLMQLARQRRIGALASLFEGLAAHEIEALRSAAEIVERAISGTGRGPQA